MDGRQPFKYEVPEYSKLVITGVTFFFAKTLMIFHFITININVK